MRIADASVPAVRTTVEAPVFQGLLARMVEVGVGAATMEVSSHALELGRVAGTQVRRRRLHEPSVGPPRLPLDDGGLLPREGPPLLARPRRARSRVRRRRVGPAARARGQIPVVRLATRPEAGAADWSVEDVGLAPDGVGVRVHPRGARRASASAASSPLPARHQRLECRGRDRRGASRRECPEADAVAGVAGAPGVPGRMERVIERERRHAPRDRRLRPHARRARARARGSAPGHAGAPHRRLRRGRRPRHGEAPGVRARRGAPRRRRRA